MDKDTQLKEQIAAEASDWIVRLQEAELSAALRAEFVEWLLRSPDHVEEFLAISHIWGETQHASASRFDAEQLVASVLLRSGADNVIALDAVRQMPKVDEGEGRRAYASRKSRFGAVAAVVLVALTTITWLRVDGWMNPNVIRTAIGEQRSITLSDGSIVDINTDSELRVDLEGQERRLRLVRGEARFKVAKDPQRPFIVATPQATIRALGTIFNVRAESERTAVAVLEGHVLVREFEAPRASPGDIAHIELKAGQQAAVNLTGEIVPAAGPPIERVAQWTNRRLVFREEPLAVVVAEFNRYHRTPIRIETPQLAGLLISGTFDSSDLNSLLEYFARFEKVNVERDGDSIRLSLPSAHAPL
ncbi:FecR family protein [Steroidobacter cummioxidans]|uniref:FecR family protein n=1 Tax=Steroidobacter cummioxidans TaxID=1803913 RepID=UPI000E321696|nr:FecR domain-containing protein [Steroidobacter cummioxidans]